VIKIVEGAIVNQTPPVLHRGMMKTMMAASPESATTSIEAGEEVFSLSLQVTFGIK